MATMPDAIEKQAIKLRSYQMEMFQRSLEGNTIIVMETGSGKTPVALFRIIHALETNNNDMLIWFLTEGVALCRQQHEALGKICPSARSKLIVGEDGPKLWGSKTIWDEVLDGVDVMFSTFEVLRQALAHAYVSICKLQMLIFDEAHHVTKNHPANEIMKIYHKKCVSQGQTAMPSILGLTASPSENGKLSKLKVLESNLTAVCRAPRKYRLEMRHYIYRPSLMRLEYAQAPIDHSYDDTLQQIPSPTFGGVAKSAKAIKSVYEKVTHLAEELGWWSAMMFVEELIESLRYKLDQHRVQYGILSTNEKKIILDALILLSEKTKSMNALKAQGNSGMHVSAKLWCLIDHLNNLIAQRGQGFIGIVFARQRVTTVMMAKLLCAHHSALKDLMPATYVGESNITAYSKDLSELVVPRTQRNVLASFKKSETKLLIATDALDEGIDVAACNTIVCYDVPANLRSFIQKRGRARKDHSTFTIMVPQGSDMLSKRDFEVLEEHMLKVIQEENNEVQLAQKQEAIVEHVEFALTSSIGACLTASMARAHLEHYCAKLPRPPYTETRPTFSCSEDAAGLIRAEVQLPMSVPASVRTATSMYSWQTERAAIIDAAFHAYKGLYEESLLTEHLLPLDMKPEINDDFEEQCLAFHHLGNKWCVWNELLSPPSGYFFRITVLFHSRSTDWTGEPLTLWTRIDFSRCRDFSLFVSNHEDITVELCASDHAFLIPEETIRTLTSCTRTLLMAIRSKPIPLDEEFAIFITPDLDINELKSWQRRFDEYVHAKDICSRGGLVDLGLVVNTAQGNSLNIFKEWCLIEDDEGLEALGVDCVPFPKRRNFLNLRPTRLVSMEDDPLIDDVPLVKTEKTFFAADCLIQRLPLRYAWTMRLMPSAFHQLEAILTADQLSRSLLNGISFSNPDDLIACITCPSTGLQRNYERLEFLGDSLLKYHVSQQLFCEHSNWHEEHLTRKRNTFTANISLAKAAVHVGIDRFILKEPFGSKNWMLPTTTFVRRQSDISRHLPMKTLADVVEALIGAAFLSGGLQNARRCMHRILPSLNEDPPKFLEVLQHVPSRQANLSDQNRFNSRTERLVGYTFHNRYLITEALTHPSCTKDSSTEPYQRLEFLGDAVLDMLVVTLMFEWLPHASQSFMTKIKSTLVNANFLAFLCYSHHEVDEGIIYTQATESTPKQRQVIKHDQGLWMMMRCGNDEVAIAREQGYARFQLLRQDIGNRLQSGKSYPWEQLHLLHAPKFISDIVESIIGAIFVDSNGDLEPCIRFFGRLGGMKYLQRIIEEGIDVNHPYERLNRLLCGKKLESCYRTNKLNDALIDLDMYDGDAVIASVSSCTSKEEAKILAAGLACKHFEERI